MFFFFFSHLLRLGVDLGEIDQLIHVYPLLNREYLNTGDGKLTLSKNWSKVSFSVAPITVVQNLVVFAKDLENYKCVEDVLTKDSTVFLMNKGYYGCEATITDSKFHNGRVKCMFYSIFQKTELLYQTSYGDIFELFFFFWIYSVNYSSSSARFYPGQANASYRITRIRKFIYSQFTNWCYGASI